MIQRGAAAASCASAMAADSAFWPATFGLPIQQIELDHRQVEKRAKPRRQRPALSPVAFWKASGFSIVCPITSRIRPFGTSV
jgi:hypothetical protein